MATGRPLDLLKDFEHLLLGGAVNPRIGYGSFPVPQMSLLLIETGELASFQSVALHILNSQGYSVF
jgi:hypothetical protein